MWRNVPFFEKTSHWGTPRRRRNDEPLVDSPIRQAKSRFEQKKMASLDIESVTHVKLGQGKILQGSLRLTVRLSGIKSHYVILGT